MELWGLSTRVKNLFEIFEEEEREETKVQVPKGCIIEISMSDEAQTFYSALDT